MRILALSEANILSIHSMAIIAAAGKDGISANKIAELTSCSKHHLFKVLDTLAKSGFIYSTRGPAGGYHLKKNAEDILLIQLFESLNGQVNEDELCYGKDRGSLNNLLFDNLCSDLSLRFINYMRNTKLSDIMHRANFMIK